MIDRIIDLADAGAYLRAENEQLRIERDGALVAQTPLAEVGVLIVTHPQVVCTQAVLAGVMRHGGAIVACGSDCLPVGLMLPLVGHSTQTERIVAQAGAPRPRCKRLWQQLVRAKIRAQADLLRELRDDDGGLPALISQVRSGDPGNVEARAAQRYWPLLFANPDFRRRREAPDANRFLNYGYAVLRAVVARALVATGLHPGLGLHHHNRYDAFALAADVMEPLRPCVDRGVVTAVEHFGTDGALDRNVKAVLLGPILGRWGDGREARTMFDWCALIAQSLADALTGKSDRLVLPEMLSSVGATGAED